MNKKYNFKFFQNKDCEFFPCHKIAKAEDFNCLFCYCPIYTLGDKCGGDFEYLENGVKDCSNCTLPHIKENYNIIVDRVSVLVDKVRINDDKYKVKELIIATTNENKIKEFKNIFLAFDLNVKIFTLNDFEKVDEPIENQSTFKDNSLLKAKYYGQKFKIPVIAEDSGLVISCLNGFPGINSKKWMQNHSYDEKNKTIISLVNEKNEKRDAKYICAITFYDSKINFHRSFFGEWRGYISKKPLGSKGFGYDPIFIDEKHKKTVAEMCQSIKNKRSHRASATMGFLSWLSFFI